MLKPSQTYTTESTSDETVTEKEFPAANHSETQEQKNAKGALEVFTQTLDTPVRKQYETRINESYDVEGQSPCFCVYKKLYEKAFLSEQDNESTCNTASGLDLLADVAISQEFQRICSNQSDLTPQPCLGLNHSEQSSNQVRVQ